MTPKKTKSSDPEDTKPQTHYVAPIILRVAKRIGAEVLIEPEFGFVGRITFANGKTTFFRNSNLNINPVGSYEIAKDKGYASFFLAKFGYPVPEGQTFFSEELCRRVVHPRNIDDGFVFAQQLGFPVIIKPNNRSQGLLVTKVYTGEEYYQIARAIFRTESVLLVQRYYQGNDFRIVVLDDGVISAYQRLPLTVIGDGRSTVIDLLQKKQQEYRQIGRDTVIESDDPRILMNLGRQGLRLSSILPNSRKLQLLDNANLSTGGDAIDLTGKVHSEWCYLAVEMTAKMGLRLCGVDILTDDISAPLSNYVVLEINGTPGFDNYASIGKTQTEIVDSLFEKVLLALER